MKNILFLHPSLLFYKARLYNQLASKLQERGYGLYVWCTDISRNTEPIYFNLIESPMTVRNLYNIIRQYNISIIINILSGVSILPFYLMSIFIAKILSIKLIYYGHGVDLTCSAGGVEHFLHNLKHFFFDRILIYHTQNIASIWKKHWNKVYIAYNSLLLNRYDEISRTADIASLRLKYKIQQNHKKLILFCGRIEERKRIGVLLRVFIDSKNELQDACLVIVGPGLPDHYRNLVDMSENIYYLGPIYDEKIMGEIFYMSDIFCVPGSLGLGIVEAIYWGKPVLTLKAIHGPEIGYLKNGYNGYILDDERKLLPTLKQVLSDEAVCSRLARNARKTYLEEANVERMFQGFYDVLKSLCQ